MTGADTDAGEEAPPSSWRGLWLGVLAWLAFALAWLTWSPFLPRPQGSSAPLVILQAPTNVLEIGINLVLFVPVGFVVAAPEPGGSGRGRRHRLLHAALVAGLLSVALEAGQVGLATRTPSAYDVALNVAGAGIGAWLAERAHQSGGDPRWLVALTASHLYLAVLVYVLVMTTHLGGAHRLSDWVATFPVTQAEEVGGERRYLGEVLSSAICSGAGAGRICVAPGAGARAREELVETVDSTRTVELRATVRSASDEQTGPVRIVTFSGGILQRNAMLGQRGDSLVLRLRTPFAGPNGSDVELYLPDAVPANVETRVSATYDAGRVTLRADRAGETLVRRVEYPLLLWSGVMTRNVGSYEPMQIAFTGVLGLLVLFFPLGVGSASLPGTAGRLWWLEAPALATALYLILLRQLEIGLRHDWWMLAVGVALLGAVAVRLLDLRAAPCEPGEPGA